jgi:hypothetical protein
MSPYTSLTFKLHRRRESAQTRMAPGALPESCRITHRQMEYELHGRKVANHSAVTMALESCNLQKLSALDGSFWRLRNGWLLLL